MKRTALARRTPLAARSGLARGTAPHATGALSRRPMPRRPSQPAVPTSTGPDEATVALVLARDEYACVRCGGPIQGTRGWDWSIHHRKLRSQGGGHTADNLITLHGHGSAGCHGATHNHPAPSYDAGWLVHRTDRPDRMPVTHARHGRVLLSADGTHQPITDGDMS